MHVLDRGASPAAVEGLLSTAGDLVDIVKTGAKDAGVPVAGADWAAGMAGDLASGRAG